MRGVSLCLPLFAAAPRADLQHQLAHLAVPAQGRVGVALIALESDEAFSLHGADRFPMQSVYKVPIAMAVLHEIDQGTLGLDQRIRVDKSDFVHPGQHSPIRDAHPEGGFDMTISELLRYNVSESDGSACDVLLRLIGGPKTVDAYLHGLGIRDIAVANTEKEIGVSIASAISRATSRPDGEASANSSHSCSRNQPRMTSIAA